MVTGGSGMAGGSRIFYRTESKCPWESGNRKNYDVHQFRDITQDILQLKSSSAAQALGDVAISAVRIDLSEHIARRGAFKLNLHPYELLA